MFKNNVNLFSVIWRSDYTSNQGHIGICALFEVTSGCQSTGNQKTGFLNMNLDKN